LIAQLDSFENAEAGFTDTVFNGVRLSTRSTPAQYAAQGGDWCETFVLSRDVVALSIGDVCGHGAQAFPAMSVIRRAVREAALRGLDPARTLAAANRFVCDLDPDLHATAFFALLDTRHRIVTFANSGHPPPLMLAPSGSRFLMYADADLPLGIETALTPKLRVASMPDQSLLVLYTDGVTEHERRPIRGEAQLRDAAGLAYEYSVSRAASAIDALMFLSPANRDDASILTAWMPLGSRGLRVDRTSWARDFHARPDLSVAAPPAQLFF
jgi:serine phosphatase RsbU (regulator of sigma subunit)